MPDFLAEIYNQVRAIWSRLDSGQKLTIASVFTVALVGLGGILWYAAQPDYQVAYTTTNGDDLNNARRALQQAGVGFVDDGTSLLVERADRGAAQSALVSGGLVAGMSAGADNKPIDISMGSEERRYLLDERHRNNAVKALLLLEGVRDASVRHTKASDSPFRNIAQSSPGIATAIIRIKPGESFTAIARSAAPVVAAAVGVSPESVTVIDAVTNRHFTANKMDRGGNASEFHRQEIERSQELTELVQRTLDRLYPEKAHAIVTVELDPNWEIKREKIALENPIVIQERTTKDVTQGGAGGATGDPSTTAAATAGTNPGSAGGAGGMRTEKNQKEKTYEPAFSEKESGKLGAEVKYLSVALALDESIDAGKQQAIEDLVKNTIGWDATRDGARFSVLREKFEAPQELPPPPGPDPLQLLERFGPTVGQVIAVLFVVLFLRRLLKKSSGRAASGSSGSASASASASGAAASVADEDLPPDEARRRMRREIEKAIADDPATISELLEGWLTEQKA